MRNLSSTQVGELESQGVTLSGVTGGIKKRQYWLPDGNEIRAIPAIRGYIKKRDGKIIESGDRDANLDKGWLLNPPTELKLHCDGCDKWHDTQKEITDCVAKKKTFNEKWSRMAKKMKGEEGGDLREEVSELKSDITEIKKMLRDILAKE